MQIPPEAIPPAVSPRKEPAGERKVEAVASATRLADALSAPPKDQTLAFIETAERRRAERRVENRPVLLDTRSRRGRREASGEVQFSLKV